MKYYIVNKYFYNGVHTLVRNELFTLNELSRYYKEINTEHYIRRGILTEITLSSHKTFHSFGCRFEINKEH